jgi:hypothetical protein
MRRKVRERPADRSVPPVQLVELLLGIALVLLAYPQDTFYHHRRDDSARTAR